MPEIGEIIRGREIGKSPSHKFIWHACEVCKKERWVEFWKNKPISLRCLPCAQKEIQRTGEASSVWKGGRFRRSDGYIQILLQPDDFFYPMAQKGGYVMEHRLIVAKALGRCLQPWEIVHHKRGFAKDDNRYPETLQLVQEMQHNQITIMENRIERLETKVQEQGRLIKLLQWQLKERDYASNF